MYSLIRHEQGRLTLRIEYRGVVRYIMSPYEVRPSEWDAKNGVLVLDHAGEGRRRRLMDYRNAMHRDMRLMDAIVKDCVNNRSSNGKNQNKANNFIADNIANAFRMTISARRMLSVYATLLSDELIRAGQAPTARGYLTATRRMIEFNNGYDIPLDAFTPELIVSFQQSLLNEGVARTTVSFYMRTLRAIYNKAVAENIIPARLENPFLDAYTEVPAANSALN